MHACAPCGTVVGMRGLLAWVGVLALAWAAGVGTARADAVSPPPDRCPEGSVAVEFCHGPPTCRVSTCETDADCGAGMVCRDARLCTTEFCCSGRCCGGGCGVEPTVYTHVFGPCDAAGGCSDFGAACTQEKVCVPGSNTDAGTRADAGSTREDAGRSEDGGGTSVIDAGQRDAGGTGIDAGRRRDAGSTGGTTAGGCCSVVGGDSALGGVLFGLAIALTIARVSRRRSR